MAEAPIQIVLNADNYHTDRERPNGGGPEADFFEGERCRLMWPTRIDCDSSSRA